MSPILPNRQADRPPLGLFLKFWVLSPASFLSPPRPISAVSGANAAKADISDMKGAQRSCPFLPVRAPTVPFLPLIMQAKKPLPLMTSVSQSVITYDPVIGEPHAEIWWSRSPPLLRRMSRRTPARCMGGPCGSRSRRVWPREKSRSPTPNQEAAMALRSCYLPRRAVTFRPGGATGPDPV